MMLGQRKTLTSLLSKTHGPAGCREAFLDNTSEDTIVDLTQSEIDEIRSSVGGEENYAALMQWATESFPQELVKGSISWLIKVTSMLFN